MIGQTINNYLLERKLGEGGMGDVYFARHNRIDRVVAIKVLHKNLFTNENIRTRFKNEANALIKLGHPNIVKIYDYVEQDEFACLIMEYIEGFTLDEYITKISGPLPAAKAINIICSVLDAVQYAHDNNIFHRDIKPGNIMVSRNGKIVRIMDFSIAKFTDLANLKTTHANAQLGTPFYMSPEQVKGMPYTALSDIYSLGVTLFEMITGKCPYLEITNLFELQSKIVNEPLPPTGKYYHDVSPKIQETIKIATNKIPDLRFKNCNEFKAYLVEEQKLNTNPSPKQNIVPQKIQAQFKPEIIKLEPSNEPVFISENKKNRGWVYLLGLFALLVIGFIIYAFINQSDPSKVPLPGQQNTTVGKKNINHDTIALQDSNKSEPSRNIPQEAEKLILDRESKIKTFIADSIKRNQLKNELIDALDNNQDLNRIITILDSSFKKIFEINKEFPPLPSRQILISDLNGKIICNGQIIKISSSSGFSYGISKNDGQQCNFSVQFKNGDGTVKYSIYVFYIKKGLKYVYQRNTCTTQPIQPQIPATPKNDCADAPTAPSKEKVTSDLRNYLKSGGFKVFGFEYLKIDQMSETTQVGEGVYSSECINISFVTDFKVDGRGFKCQVIYSNKAQIYKPIDYNKL